MHTFRRSAALALVAVVAIAGCSGKDGKNGANGVNGVSTGTLSGKVTIASTTPAIPVVGASIALSPTVEGVTLTTNATGDYSAVVPVGVYTLTITAPNFTTQTQSVSVVAAGTATRNVALVATAKVVVAITTTGTANPGAQLSVTATPAVLDGSTVQSIAWSTGVHAAATFGTPTAATTTAQLPALSTFKDSLFRVLRLDPLADPDANANPPELPAGTSDAFDNRLKVQGITHFDLERAAEVMLTATVTTTSGVYTATQVVSAVLPWKPSTGLASVPLNEPVVVHGFLDTANAQTSYSYTLAGPSGDATTLLDSTTSRHVVFTPTASGKYTLTESVSGKTLDIYAGTWVGAIDPAATLAATDSLKPVGDGNCTGCHASGTALDKFTPWAQSGHASIFSTNVIAGGHYGESCFDCHTVGFDKGALNNGVDEQSDYVTMVGAMFPASNHGAPIPDAGNWDKILGTYPVTAKMTNIQCENCHGPNAVTGASHSATATRDAVKAARVSLDSAVCGRCHGEPARHGRFQEWSISGHGNLQLAADEGTSGNCAGCHTAQGAMVFFAQLATGNPLRTITLPAGLTADTALPQTCSVCHDPHDPGSTSSLGTNANPRIMDATSLLPSGFKAVGVGKGAMCITCHNSRNGGWTDTTVTPNVNHANLHEDGDAHFGTLAAFSAPHEAAQGDVLMGRNAYFVSGVRGPHSLVPNACVTCHMDSVAAPQEIGYSTQSNHTFEANLTICAKCHGSFDGAGLQAATAAGLADLKATVEGKLASLYEAAGTTIEWLPGRTPKVCVNGCQPIVPPATSPPNAVDEITYLTGKTSTQVDTFAKANWNYELVAADNSGGVHNPSFVQDVLFRTAQKVNGLTTP
jgi:formate-dependent nitrite reductase cytochrome c552 subunit